jgi:hypothetical protein
VTKESILICPQSHLLYLTPSYRYEGILAELVNAATFSCPVLALRVISRVRNNQVAFGAKRTSDDRQDRLHRSRMTQAEFDFETNNWKRLSARSLLHENHRTS